MINAVENVSTQSQCVKPFTDHWVPNDSNGSSLYAIKWIKVLGRTCPEVTTVLPMADIDKAEYRPYRANQYFDVKYSLTLLWPLFSLRPTWPCVSDDCDVWVLIRQVVKYFIFSFPRSDIKAKLGVGFRHSTRNASRMAKKGKQNVNTRLSLSTLLHTSYSVKLRDKNILFNIK